MTELRVSRALRDRGAELPAGGPHVYLTDTLESPYAEPQQLPLFFKPIADQHAKALNVKSKVPVIVCLGNPPYDRHEAADESNKARTGSWVRWGDDGKAGGAILRDFRNPAIASGHGGDIKNLYNLYVYFWRWALWKVFEHHTSTGPGVVSFISASSYLEGDAFSGMREHMRRLCHEIWILDLGGEGRGTRKSENVFAIQTPVPIAVAVRASKAKKTRPATVHYARIEGTRQAKLAALSSVNGFASIRWQDCPDTWQAPFRPAGKGRYFDWPLLTDLMPWQHSGFKAGRTWVISPDADTLHNRWHQLLSVRAEKRRDLFKDSPTERNVHEAATELAPSKARLKAIIYLAPGTHCPTTTRFAYRSFDRQFIFADPRLLDRPAPALWRAHGERQVYLTTLLNHPLGQGPTMTACAHIPDLHHFRGSFGAKEVFPLYCDAGATKANIPPGLLELLGKAWQQKVTPEDFFAYVYGILAHPEFTARYAKELETRQLRVPLTKSAALFRRVRDIGARLLWLHTYGERFVPKGKQRGYVPRGLAKCVRPVSGQPHGYPDAFDYFSATRTLQIGGGQFRPVAPEVFEFQVSGLKVVQSWLGYRMRKGYGKKSSRLDSIRPERWTGQFTTELLGLLWVLEATIESYPEQRDLLDAVVSGPSLQTAELPAVPDTARKPAVAQFAVGSELSLFETITEEVNESASGYGDDLP